MCASVADRWMHCSKRSSFFSVHKRSIVRTAWLGSIVRRMRTVICTNSVHCGNAQQPQLCRTMCEGHGNSYFGIATTSGKIRWAVTVLLGLLSLGLTIGYVVQVNNCNERTAFGRYGMHPQCCCIAYVIPYMCFVSSTQMYVLWRYGASGASLIKFLQARPRK